MRETKQGKFILNLLNNSYNHPTAYDIYESCKKEFSNISLATVYRNLNKLVSINKIKRIKMPNNIDRFDKMDIHPHFICVECGKIIDLKNNIKFDLLPDNLKIIDYEINFKGICEKCQKGELWN